jgi:CDP-glucose 4,6-dehydratase
MDLSFYRGKKILITGHTGFKGSWMSQLLLREGAEVYGYAKQPPTAPSMYGLCGLKTEMESIEGDVRDLDTLRSVFLRVSLWCIWQHSRLCVRVTGIRLKHMRRT